MDIDLDCKLKNLNFSEEETLSFNSITLYQKINKLPNSNLTIQVVLAVHQMLVVHDKYTCEHSINVAEISWKMAQALNISEQERQNLYLAALLHDIGKILIPRQILNKLEPLSKREYELIKLHPIWAYNFVSQFEDLDEVANIVLNHHERFDGRGYPRGIGGEKIPFLARVITIADAWDAMRSDRVYRPGLTEKEAVQEIVNNQGTQFDPFLADVFLNIVLEN